MEEVGRKSDRQAGRWEECEARDAEEEQRWRCEKVGKGIHESGEGGKFKAELVR